MEKIIDISYGFVKKTGIVPIDVDREISKIRKKGGHATMLIFGRVVISDSNPGKSGYLVEELTVSKDMPKIF